MVLPPPSRARPRRRRAAAGVAFAVALAASVARAENPPPSRLDPIAVTATRSAQPIADLLADLTVIEPEEIARSGAQSLTELLQRQPGVEIVQNGGPGSTSGVFLRGSNRGQTLVLVDGVRLGSSTVGATSLEAIPLDQIERIEVLRGPASSLYGADAIGGVIQVFTRKGTRDFAFNASGGGGTYRTWKGSAGFSGSLGPLALSFQGGGTTSGGYNAIVDPQSFAFNDDRDGYSQQNVNASATLDVAPGQSLSAQVFRNRLNNQFDGGPGFDDRTITTLESWQVATSNRLAEGWRSTLTAATGSDDSLTRTGFGDADYRTLQRQFTWQNELSLPAGQLTLGYERLDEEVAAAGFPEDRRVTNSFYGIYQLREGPHAVQANVRSDDSAQYGQRTTGALVYGYRLSADWRFTVGAASAFKPPSFNDLYYPGFSNPNLLPETSRNVEAGAYWTGTAGEAKLSARAIGWYNKVERLIVFGCDADFNCRPDNVDEARLKGVTLGADASWRSTTLRGSVDLQSPENANTGNLLPRRARAHGALSLLQQVGPGNVGVEVVASSRRFDDPANLVPLAGYAILNLTLEWPLGDRLALFARGDNVLDRSYQLAYGYSTGGAQAFVGVRWKP